MDGFQGAGLGRCAAQPPLSCRLPLFLGQAVCCQLCASACRSINQGWCPLMPTMAISGRQRGDQSKGEKVSTLSDKQRMSPRTALAPWTPFVHGVSDEHYHGWCRIPWNREQPPLYHYSPGEDGPKAGSTTGLRDPMSAVSRGLWAHCSPYKFVHRHLTAPKLQQSSGPLDAGTKRSTAEAETPWLQPTSQYSQSKCANFSAKPNSHLQCISYLSSINHTVTQQCHWKHRLSIPLLQSPSERMAKRGTKSCKSL